MPQNFHTRPIESFHQVGESTWDAAWVRAQEWAQQVHDELTPAPYRSGIYNAYYGTTITFEPKVYAFDGPLRLAAAMHLKGAGSLYGTILYFPKSDGIIAAYDPSDSDGDGKRPFGQESLLENLYIKGEMAPDTDYDGILMRTNIIVRDCHINGFSRDGIHIEANLSDLPTAPRYGNACCWQLYNVVISACGRHGLYTDGGDANGGTAIAVKVVANGYSLVRPVEKDIEGGRYAIYDSSFLGNTYVSCLTEGCNTNSPLLKSGGFKTEGGSNFSAFIGCYAELDSPCDIHHPAIWVGRGIPNNINGANPPAFLSSNGFQNQLGVHTFHQEQQELDKEVEMDARLYDPETPPFSEEIGLGKGLSIYLGRDYDQVLSMAPKEQRVRYEKSASQRPLKLPAYTNFQNEPGFSLSYDFGARRRYDFGMAKTAAILSFKKDPLNDDKLYFPRGFHLGFGGTPDRFVKVVSNHEPPNWDASIYVWEEGDVVLNSQPSRSKPYAGWIYTAEGWKPYGRIEF